MSPERIRNEPYSYTSDIWSMGIVLQECATGQYPFAQQFTCIEMAQTILDAHIPELPNGRFSIEFREFLHHCLRPNPDMRPVAEVLLSSPWLIKNDAVSADAARYNVFQWIRSLQEGNTKEADYRRK
jgi:serine/threonine protein kinase